ncbi:Cirhin [Brachionus plicatilis]|uniref:Cirhin n=1 Tax=Brachionus plicatilis TaxID=10195 RepID=A0A3M7PRN8_BRAPC|nr:Cirhin [Brachionus plicatilis]
MKLNSKNMGDYIVHRARFFDYQPKAIQSMNYDETVKKLAISRSDSTIEIWCTKNEFLESIIYPTADRQVESVLWCRSQLLSSGLDGFIVLYDLARLTAKKLVPSIGGAIWCMNKNKSETKIVVGTEDGYVVMYEVQIDGILFEKSFNKLDSRILSIAWHKDEEVLITGGIDNIRVWDANSGQVLQRLSLGRIDKNKETLVWCLAITSDFQIISGDSRGKISVWNAEHGNLIKSFQTHSVDVLCLCIDETEKHIYCSGIDPSIVQLDYIATSQADNYKTWVKSNVYYQHSHDVRSLLIADNQLISAGVDTKIVFKSLEKKHCSKNRKYNSMPQKSLIHTCSDYVLLQHDKHLEIWKLGQSGDNLNLDEKKDGDCLSILRSAKKYLHLNSKNDLNIVCSSIGALPSEQNAQTIWMSYSDLNAIHIYKLEISSKQLLEPKIKVAKIKSLPLACGNRPAVMMNFYFSASSNQLRLNYLTNKSCLQSLYLLNDELGFALDSTIQCISQDLLLTDNRVYLMDFKEDYVATADTDMNIVIWSLKSQSQLCSLPKYERLATSLKFHPSKSLLLVCYANRTIVEYDYELNEYSDWSRQSSKLWPKQWLKSNNKILNCFYDGRDQEKIILHDEQYLIIVDKNEKMPDFNEKIFQPKYSIKSKSENGHCDKQHAIHVSDKYRYIVHVSEPMQAQLLIVEVTPLSVSERLPPSLKQKKFGT